MTPELKNAFEKAKKIIYNKKEILVDSFPVVHELEDGILIKFFSGWEVTEYDEIKIKKITSIGDDSSEKIYMGFVPKGIKIKARSNNYMECLICLDGKLVVDIGGNIKTLNSLTKMCIHCNTIYGGEALKDSYFILITYENCK